MKTLATFPEQAFRAWAETRLSGNGEFQVSRLKGGNSNEMLVLSRTGRRWVLRRPPPGASRATHDLAREMTILSGLRDSDVPHAALVAGCADPAVMGTPFAVLEWVDGMCPYASLPGDADSHDAAVLAESLVKVLSQIHAVPWATGPLAPMGRATDFCARQAARWTAQLDSYRGRALPDLDGALALLDRRVPSEHPGALIHGDYGLHNVLTTDEPPLRVMAVVDWETATIGHPLSDLGHLLTFWPESSDPTPWRDGLPPVAPGLYPPRQRLVEHYMTYSDSDSVDDVVWFAALAALRMAVILEGTYQRRRGVHSDDPFTTNLDRIVPYLARLGMEYLEGGNDRLGLA
jgi:aminoglycoside phosphotransferase (APT) family kinase protein